MNIMHDILTGHGPSIGILTCVLITNISLRKQCISMDSIMHGYHKWSEGETEIGFFQKASPGNE